MTKLREHWDETNTKVLQRKAQLDAMLGDSQRYEGRRDEVETWLQRMETRLERMRPVGNTADVLEAQLREQKVRKKTFHLKIKFCKFFFLLGFFFQQKQLVSVMVFLFLRFVNILNKKRTLTLWKVILFGNFQLTALAEWSLAVIFIKPPLNPKEIACAAFGRVPLFT